MKCSFVLLQPTKSTASLPTNNHHHPIWSVFLYQARRRQVKMVPRIYTTTHDDTARMVVLLVAVVIAGAYTSTRVNKHKKERGMHIRLISLSRGRRYHRVWDCSNSRGEGEEDSNPVHWFSRVRFSSVFAPVITGAPMKKPRYSVSGSSIGGGGSVGALAGGTGGGAGAGGESVFAVSFCVFRLAFGTSSLFNSNTPSSVSFFFTLPLILNEHTNRLIFKAQSTHQSPHRLPQFSKPRTPKVRGSVDNVVSQDGIKTTSALRNGALGRWVLGLFAIGKSPPFFLLYVMFFPFFSIKSGLS